LRRRLLAFRRISRRTFPCGPQGVDEIGLPLKSVVNYMRPKGASRWSAGGTRDDRDSKSGESRLLVPQESAWTISSATRRRILADGRSTAGQHRRGFPMRQIHPVSCRARADSFCRDANVLRSNLAGTRDKSGRALASLIRILSENPILLRRVRRCPADRLISRLGSSKAALQIWDALETVLRYAQKARLKRRRHGERRESRGNARRSLSRR